MIVSFIDFQDAALVVALGLARVAPAVVFLPLFGDKAMASTVVRGAMLMLIALALLPTFQVSPQVVAELPLLSLVLKEAVIGLVLGFAFAAPYVAATTCGEILDNQRGATVAKAIDPAAGVEASILATLMGFLWTVSFTMGGGILRVMTALAESYRYLPLVEPLSLNAGVASAAASLLGQALMAGILVAAPAFVAMLLVEITLGVLSRFAPQLNPFSIAMAVKSLVACLILTMYFGGWAFDFMNSISVAWPLDRFIQARP